MNKKRNRSTRQAAYSKRNTIYKAMYITAGQQRQSRMKKRKSARVFVADGDLSQFYG